MSAAAASYRIYYPDHSYLGADVSINFQTSFEGSRLVVRSKAQWNKGQRDPHQKPLGGFTKRAMDIFLVIVMAPSVLLILIGVSLLIKLQDRGPILYGHQRVGFDGRTFRCWKFRTMVVDGDRVLEDHFRRCPADRDIWFRDRKLANDPRVTPLGAVLRKLSLDEFPQLINVLNGEMSLIGPRPVVMDELNNYARSADHYLRVRPGITGLWQVSGRSNTTYHQRVMLDRYYVSNWSILLDTWILIRTIPSVLLSRGAH